MRLARHLAVVAATGVLAACGSTASRSDPGTPTATEPGSAVTVAGTTPTTAGPANDGSGSTTVPFPGPTDAVSALGPLVDRQWVADSNITVGGLRPVLPGTGAGFRIGADGSIAVNTGCNTGTGRVVAYPGNELEVVELTITERACAADVTTLEENMLLILSKVNSWQIVDGTLTLVPLTIADLGLTLTAG